VGCVWGALALLAVLLGVVAFLSGTGDDRPANVRRSALLLCWPVVFVLAAPIWLFSLAALASVGLLWNRHGPFLWPQHLTFKDGLPLSVPTQSGWLILAGMGVLYLAGLIILLLDPLFLQQLRLLGDVSLYLGHREHREQAQLRLKAEIETCARSVDCLVVGAHS